MAQFGGQSIASIPRQQPVVNDDQGLILSLRYRTPPGPMPGCIATWKSNSGGRLLGPDQCCAPYVTSEAKLATNRFESRSKPIQTGGSPRWSSHPTSKVRSVDPGTARSSTFPRNRQAIRSPRLGSTVRSASYWPSPTELDRSIWLMGGHQQQRGPCRKKYASPSSPGGPWRGISGCTWRNTSSLPRS
jgi:hypothetical protein